MAWPSAGWFVLVAPVAAVGVDGVLAEDFAGVVVEHGDGVGVDEDCHRLACMDGADAEVVHAAGAAEADLAEAVDVVVADAVVRIVALSSWGGLDGGGIGLGWGGAMERTMRPDLVVDAGEAVQLGLQFGDRWRRLVERRASASGLVEALDLALGLGMVGMAVLLCDAEVGEQVFEAVAAAGEAGSVDRAIVSECGLRQAIDAGSGQEGSDHGLASDASTREAGEQVAGVVVEPVDDLHAGAVG